MKKFLIFLIIFYFTNIKTFFFAQEKKQSIEQNLNLLSPSQISNNDRKAYEVVLHLRNTINLLQREINIKNYANIEVLEKGEFPRAIQNAQEINRELIENNKLSSILESMIGYANNNYLKLSSYYRS